MQNIEIPQNFKQFTIQKCDTKSKIQLGQKTQDDVKYQDIVYFKGGDTTPTVNDVHIDFLKAMSEMEKLPIHDTDNSFIGFKNLKNNDFIQFLRPGKNDWYADVPIDNGPNWKGYVWGCRIDTELAAATLRLFFEEMPWFGMINWTRRKTKYAKD